MRALMGAVLAMSAMTGCHAVPELHGTPLTCNDDDSCPSGLRCYAGGCIRNAAPTIEPLGVLFATVNTPITLGATVDDAEDDSVTVEWAQTAGPSVMASPVTGASITVTPQSEGTYAFTVTPRDPYAAGAATPLSVVAINAPPPPSVVYVADTGLDAADCGTLSAPCATVGMGLSRRSSSASPLLVAVAHLGRAYQECLRLAGTDTLFGGFDATWRFDPLLRDRTRIECVVPAGPPESGLPTDVVGAGHIVRGNASLADVALAADVSEVAAEEDKSLVTVLFNDASGQASLRGVLVEAPSCEQPCVSVGIRGDAASPRLHRVAVRGRADELKFPAVFAGMAFQGGSPRITGDADGGSVLLNVAAADLTVGIVAFDAVLDVEGMQIAGGLGSVLAGILISGGSPRVVANTIDLRGFGAVLVFGITASPCLLVPSDCATFGRAPPVASIRGNTVTLRGGTGTFGQTPCFGSGVSLVTDFDGHAPGPLTGEVSDNQVSIEGGFALTMGVTTAGGVAENSLNEVSIGASSVDDPSCEFLNKLIVIPAAEFHGGAIGMAVLRPASDRVQNNTVAVQANSDPTLGLWVLDAEGAEVTGNQIDVGNSALLLSSAEATAVTLRNRVWGGASVSRFDANRLYVHDGALAGTGLRFAQASPWLATNNFIYGGDAPFATGVAIETDGIQTNWPQLLHNTIHAGGLAGGTAVSRALAVSVAGTSGDAAETPGLQASPAALANNLVDVGDGTGRRFVFDNPTGVFLNRFLGNTLHRQGNRAPVGVTAGLVLPGRAHGVAPSAGSLVSAEASVATPWTREGWRPLNGAVISAWAGGVDALGRTGAVVAGSPGSVALAELGSAGFGQARRYPTTVMYGDPPQVVTLTPALVARGRFDAADPPDVVFVTTAAGSGVAGLWWMPAAGSGGPTTALGSPLLVKALDTPTHLAVSEADDDIKRFARAYVVEQPVGAPYLTAWPELPGAATVTLPSPVTALAAGLIGDGSGRSPVVATIAAGSVHLWRTTNFASEVAIADVPCVASGGIPSSLSIGLLACTSQGCRNRLLVGCSNGHLAAMEIGSSGLRFEARSDAAAVAKPVQFAASYNDILIVGYSGDETIAVYEVNLSMGILRLLGSRVTPGDVGEWNTGTFLYTDADALAVVGLNPGVCALEARNGGGSNPPDLHLDAGVVDDCRNTGASFTDVVAQTPITDTSAAAFDIDLAARQSSTPDVGADEE